MSELSAKIDGNARMVVIRFYDANRDLISQDVFVDPANIQARVPDKAVSFVAFWVENTGDIAVVAEDFSF
jgi:hypothetical protein